MFQKLACFLLLSMMLYSGEIGNAFQRGKASGHVGIFAHIDFVGDSTFLDLNTSLSYQSANFYGYKFFVSAWFNPPLYEVNNGFKQNKSWFEIAELGVNFFNSRLNFGFDAGRFAYKADWVSNYVQGLSFFHTYSPLISYSVTWINQSALIQTDKILGFNQADNWIGGILLDARFKIPNTIIEITPYIYSVANLFWAPSIGANAKFEFLRLNADLIWRGNLLSYIAYHNNRFRGSGVLFYSDLVYKDRLRNFDVGGGIMTTNANGVPDLDVFGQNTEFSNIDGVLLGNTTTLYAFGKFRFQYDVDLKTAMRLSIKGKQNVFDFEAGVRYFPVKKLELGLDIIALSGNQIKSQDCYIMKTFLQYHF